MTTNMDTYAEATETGERFTALLGDSCERLAELPDNSVDMSVQSPPFASLFTYSPSDRDLGNNSTREGFLEHYRFIIDHQLRVTKPGRIACVHVQQLTTTKATQGYVGLTDFRGEVIREHQAAGWIFYGEVTVWKDPQAQSIRTKAFTLSFATKNRDSAATRPALADYLLIFKKPGDNVVPIRHEATSGEVTNNDWIDWASPIWSDHHDGGWIDGDHISPVWWGIRETETLQYRNAREPNDEKHIAPLQLGFVERCVRLWSNLDELILSCFMGIGTEGYVAIKQGRRFIGCELKPSYWAQAVKNLWRAEIEVAEPSLFGTGTQ